MPLQQINWLQIDTEVIPSGFEVTLGSPDNRFESVYTKDIDVSGSIIVSGGLDVTGDVVIGGNLTVQGTTTTVNSTTIDLGDNIIALNGSAGALGGIQVNDPTNPSTISGSLLWDSVNDYWIAGPSGSEEKVVLLSDLTSAANQNIWWQTGSYHATSNDLQVTGSVTIKGDLKVEGTTTLVQTVDPNIESLIVSGAISVVKNQISGQIVSASIAIENLGTLADRAKFAIIDCGDGFF